jgi:hypothetical protein
MTKHKIGAIILKVQNADHPLMLKPDELFSELEALEKSDNERNQKIAHSVGQLLFSSSQEIAELKVARMDAIKILIHIMGEILAELETPPEKMEEMLRRTLEEFSMKVNEG